jgi:hypothetical protein
MHVLRVSSLCSCRCARSQGRAPSRACSRRARPAARWTRAPGPPAATRRSCCTSTLPRGSSRACCGASALQHGRSELTVPEPRPCCARVDALLDACRHVFRATSAPHHWCSWSQLLGGVARTGRFWSDFIRIGIGQYMCCVLKCTPEDGHTCASLLQSAECNRRPGFGITCPPSI